MTEALKAKRLEEERLAKQKEAEEADMKARVAEVRAGAMHRAGEVAG